MVDYKRYTELVKQIDYGGCTQPPSDELYAEILQNCRSSQPLTPARLQRVSLVAALVSFIDDYSGPYPALAFSKAPVLQFIHWLETLKAPVTLGACFRHSVLTSQDSLLESILVLHAALRQLARARDNRSLGPPHFTLERRITISRNILPFHPALSRGGDPLGDAYHYTANLCIGLASATCPIHQRWPVPLFLAGPFLVQAVRQGIFRSPLFCGNHARIDWLGMEHGLRLGRDLSRAPTRLWHRAR